MGIDIDSEGTFPSQAPSTEEESPQVHPDELPSHENQSLAGEEVNVEKAHNSLAIDDIPTAVAKVNAESLASLPETSEIIEATVETADIPTKELIAVLDLPGNKDDYFEEDLYSSLAATNKAAEQWHSSWKKFQLQEARPALTISRGQAEVPEPLKSEEVEERPFPIEGVEKNSSLFSWLSAITLIILIGGLGFYLFSTYVVPTPTTPTRQYSTDTPPPTLSIPGTPGLSIARVPANKVFRIHGEHFNAHHLYTFTLNTTSLRDTQGNILSVHSNNHGAFEIDIPLTTTIKRGIYSLQVRDTTGSQNVFIDLEIT